MLILFCEKIYLEPKCSKNNDDFILIPSNKKAFQNLNDFEEFYIDRKNTARLFHKHLNHNTAKTHEEIYKYVKDWMLYNKKPEFSDGKLFYENINDICLSNSQLSENSIVKKLN